MAGFHVDYISSINEVKQWLSYKGLDEFIYLLLDHGYDDLASIAACNEKELSELVGLFSTAESAASIRRLVEAIRQVGIDVYRKQKTEFRRLIEQEEGDAQKQVAMAKQVSRVRGETLKGAASGLLTAAIQASQAAAAAKAGSATSATTVNFTPVPSASSATPATATPTTAAAPSTAAPAVAGVANSCHTASLLAVKTPNSPINSPLKMPPPISPAVAASASAAAANPTAAFDVASWEGAIHFQAYLHTIQCYARAFDEPILAPQALEIKLLDGRTDVHLKKIQRCLHSLVDGCVFKKFKRGSSARRLIWTSASFDFVVWGDEDRSLIKGYINTHDIQEINQGFASKNRNRLYIVSPERTLELEAKDGAQAREWKEKLELLIQLNMSELEQKQALQQSGTGGVAFQTKFARARADYTKLICTGSVFKKWPGAGKLGSFTTRLVWSPTAVDRLQWGDLMNKKVMGFVLIQDIVEVRPHPDDKLKFTLFAIKRSLDLEARNEQTREKWIKALRFFIEFHLNMKLIPKQSVP